jgi:hypothetical protein
VLLDATSTHNPWTSSKRNKRRGVNFLWFLILHSAVQSRKALFKTIFILIFLTVLSALADPNMPLRQIKQAFRKKSLECHPDLCPPSERASAENAFKELAEAYAKLSGRKWPGKTGVQVWKYAIACLSMAIWHSQGYALGTYVNSCLAGTPVSDWSQHNFYQQARQRRAWSGSRTPARFSNAGLALLICIPLAFTGVMLGQ